MENITIILVLLLAVVLSGFLCRMSPVAIPRPLLQIALGCFISIATDMHVALNPEVFFLLLLPPLLFLDGWRIPREELKKDISTILELALGLVFLTVLGVGFFVHWLIPAIPLAVSFALAAVISPTDPIAVSAIAARVPIPKRMMHILEGESLLNDASGLVCLRFAIMAALTGSFSLYDAALSFLWMAFGGISIGIGVTWAITQVKDRIANRYGEETGSQILISLLIPFASYLAAEHLHCSGILAAVAAGLTMGFVESSGRALAITRIRRNTVWDTLQFAVNGIIFVLLGEQLPNIAANAADLVHDTGHKESWWLIVYVLAINAALALLRFLWVWVSLKLTMLRARHNHTETQQPHWRLIAAMSLAGARGAITLAGVLTLPLVFDDGSAFPARDLAIFLAMGVIITSLVAASLLLPWLLKGLVMPQESHHEAEESFARAEAGKAAIAAIEKVQHELAEGREDADMYVVVASRLMQAYRAQIEAHESEDGVSSNIRHMRGIEKAIRLTAIREERGMIFRLFRTRRIGSETARKLVRELDMLEAQLEG